MGETLKVQTTYAEVLKSSMGPDWYKEAQLDLINEFRKSDIPLDAVQVAHMAAIFEEASGEMTFQRYVQQEKRVCGNNRQDFFFIRCNWLLYV